MTPVAAQLAQRDRIDALVTALQPTGDLSLPRSAAELAARGAGRGIVVLLSDFLFDVAATAAACQLLSGRGLEVVALQIADPAEVEFPFNEPLLLTDAEDGSTLTIEAGRFRDAYRAAFTTHVAATAAAVRRTGGDHFLATSGVDPGDALAEYLHQRAHRLGGEP